MKSAADYLESLYDPRIGGFRFHDSAPATLLSTSFAIQTGFVLGALDRFDRLALGRTLASGQRSDGLFVDPLFRPEDTSGSHRPEYIEWQFTFFALTALDMLGESAPRPLTFVEPLLASAALEAWFCDRSWKSFWYASNELMFLLFFLTYRSERDGDARSRRAAERLLALLDGRQDRETGYWGDASDTLHRRMYGAAHVCMFYDFYDREIRFAERIIDSTLSLQDASGLYGSRHGGACEDYDAVEVLLKVGRRTPHRRQDVLASVRRTADAIRGCRDASGGFSYWLDPPGATMTERIASLWSRGRTYAYSGWRPMTARGFRPDTWATFFRELTLATADAAAGASGARFHDLPAWGYHR